MDREIRVAARLTIEERAKDGTVAPTIVGYAAVFDTETDIGGMFRERIAPGAFAEAIRNSDIHAVVEHDMSKVIGRNKSGTLVLQEDDNGLRVEITPPDTQDVRDLLIKMKRGDIDQMSFGFTMAGGKQSWDDSAEPPLRTIEKIGELFDVSIVARGAYPTTEAAVRSLDAHRKAHNFSAAKLRLRRKMNLEQKLRSTAR